MPRYSGYCLSGCLRALLRIAFGVLSWIGLAGQLGPCINIVTTWGLSQGKSDKKRHKVTKSSCDRSLHRVSLDWRDKSLYFYLTIAAVFLHIVFFLLTILLLEWKQRSLRLSMQASFWKSLNIFRLAYSRNKS